MYKAILVYTISSDDLRSEFVDALIEKGWLAHKDQSTMVLPQKSNLLIFNCKGFKEWLEAWSAGKEWKKNDFIQVYFPKIIERGKLTIPVMESMKFYKK